MLDKNDAASLIEVFPKIRSASKNTICLKEGRDQNIFSAYEALSQNSHNQPDVDSILPLKVSGYETNGLCLVLSVMKQVWEDKRVTGAPLTSE